jgi:hypothetical protein
MSGYNATQKMSPFWEKEAKIGGPNAVVFYARRGDINCCPKRAFVNSAILISIQNYRYNHCYRSFIVAGETARHRFILILYLMATDSEAFERRSHAGILPATGLPF